MRIFRNGQTGITFTVKLRKLSTGLGYTGLTFSSSGLIIGTRAENEAAVTSYTQAGSTIETITTLGTFAAPTATKCRFKEVDATSAPGDYEIHLADARWAVSGAKSLRLTISGVSDLDEYDETHLLDVPTITLQMKRRGTAQTGAASSITLDAGAATQHCERGDVVYIVSGVGQGGSSVVSSFDTTTKIATMAFPFVTAPNNSSVFEVWSVGGVVPGDISALATAAILAAVKLKTDQLIFNADSDVQANARKISDENVVGSGTASDPWRAA